MTSLLTIRELTSDADIATAYRVMVELRPHLPVGEPFVAQVRHQQKQHGYILLGGFVGETLVALAGGRPLCTLSRGHHLFVDDLVTVAGAQGHGYGTAMLRAVARIARDRGLPAVCLDSRDTARTYYERVGFTMRTGIPCGIPTDELLGQDLD